MPTGLPCLLFAVRRESLFFHRAFPTLRRLTAAPCDACLCGPSERPVLVLETGVGRAAAETALDWLLGPSSAGRPTAVMYAGFAGALDEQLRVGDVLLADEVVAADGQSWRTNWPDPAPVGPHRGRLLTAARLVASPQEKRLLGLLHRARAVDMESAYVADRCARHGIPFGCVRAISDAAETALSPSLVDLLSGGHVSPRRVLGALLRKPSLLAAFWQLGRDTRIAARRLAAVLGNLLDTFHTASPVNR